MSMMTRSCPTRIRKKIAALQLLEIDRLAVGDDRRGALRLRLAERLRGGLAVGDLFHESNIADSYLFCSDNIAIGDICEIMQVLSIGCPRTSMMWI
ncbi:hypothetical protein A4U53_030555 [Rhizobium ruizarguesonis]|uniref:Uncharacterized protein n=1 Tax=Rhizobium ruizarguesonis TaxID=2081791 RepID=A0ACD5EM83_9HYPH|nr:hypothetical protein [Rhizobium leguminosarum]